MEQFEQQQQQQHCKPRKHSTLSLLSTAASTPISSMMLQFDSRFMPKNFFKFHKTGTDDEKMAMIERFKSEGIDPKKLNDTKKLTYIWRWLVDAEINCQSLRHQLEKMCLQHEQELQEVEDYVSQVWKLSMERLETLQNENRYLHSKLFEQQQMVRRLSENNNEKYNNMNSNDQDDDDDGDDDIEDECTNDFLAKYFKNNAKSTNKMKLVNNDDDDNYAKSLSLHSRSISSFFDRQNSNVIDSNNNINKSTKDNTNNTLLDCSRRSSSCQDVNNNINKDIDSNSNSKQIKNECNNCQKSNIKMINYQNQISELQNQLLELENNNSKQMKINRCIEIENENYAFKLAETESQCNQMEQRIYKLEQELNHKSRSPPSSTIDTNRLNLVICEQKHLIEELNDKIKHLEETLDSKCLELEELENRHHKLQQRMKQQESKESSLNFSTNNSLTSSWLLFKNNNNNNNNDNLSSNDSKNNANKAKNNNKIMHRHTSDYYGSSDGFEEIKL